MILKIIVDLSGLMVDLDIEGYSGFIWNPGGFRLWWIYLDFMVDFDIEGYSGFIGGLIDGFRY